MKLMETMSFSMAQVQGPESQRMTLATSWCLVCHQMNISKNSVGLVISLSHN